ncbi:MAG: hypothetical protein OIF56_15635 [Cohaesibacter sp.]|nr:hypothetical protein [Cohaesibacter sp.]
MTYLGKIGLAVMGYLSLTLQPALAIDTALQNKLNQAHKAGELKGLHQVLVYQGGKLLADVSYAGKDQSWGRDLGRREFDDQSLHDLRSVTKSIIGLLYGIALEHVT